MIVHGVNAAAGYLRGALAKTTMITDSECARQSHHTSDTYTCLQLNRAPVDSHVPC